MKSKYKLLLLVFVSMYSFGSLQAQDNPAVLKNVNVANTDLRKDSSLLMNNSLKNDTAKKIVAAADSTAPTPSHLELNITWQSNDVNNGRKDSSVIPLLTPKISYIFKSGFEIDLSVGYNTHEASPQVNQYTLDGSYSFNPGNYSGSVTVSGFIYSKNSGSTTAEQKGSVEYSNSYDLGFIEPSLNGTWTFGTTPTDWQLSFALQHEYDIGNLSLTPTATMNAATQNAYNAYYQNRRFSIPRHDGKPPYPENVIISGEVLNANQFQVLDYELSSPINYTAGKWTFDFTPTYALPVNPADIKLSTQINDHTFVKTYKEKLTNTFYVQLGITYDF